MSTRFVSLLLMLSLLAFIGLVLLFGKSVQLLKHIDVSIHESAAPNGTVPNVWMISYAAGHVYPANQRTLAYSALGRDVDFTLSYDGSFLDSAFVAKNKGILDQKKGGGYWLWKPYLILKTLNMMPEGDVLLYLDAGFKITHPLAPLLQEFMNGSASIAVIEAFRPISETIKRDVLVAMGMDQPHILKERQIAGGTLFIKNTAESRQLMAQWLHLCEQPGMIDNTPSTSPEHPDFQEHKNDQAILTLLRLQHPPLFWVIPYVREKEFFFWHHRAPEHFERKPKSIILFDLHGLSTLDRLIKDLLALYAKVVGHPACPYGVVP